MMMTIEKLQQTKQNKQTNRHKNKRTIKQTYKQTNTVIHYLRQAKK